MEEDEEREDIRQRDWVLGIEEEWGTVQYLAYNPSKEMPLFGFDMGNADAEVYKALSESHRFIGLALYPEALVQIQKVLVKEYGLAAAISMQAFVYFQMHKYDNALSSLHDAIEETNGSALLWHAKGTVHMKVGAFKAASECYERAISRSFFEKRSPLLHWTHLALASYYLHDFNKAIRCIRAAHKGSPDDIRPYPLLARCLHASGQYDQALEVFDAYISLVKVEWVLFLKATVLYDLKQYRECIGFLNMIKDPTILAKSAEVRTRCLKQLRLHEKDLDDSDYATLSPTLLAKAPSLKDIFASATLGNGAETPRVSPDGSSPRRASSLGATSNSITSARLNHSNSEKLLSSSPPTTPHAATGPALGRRKNSLMTDVDSRSRSRSIGQKMSKFFNGTNRPRSQIDTFESPTGSPLVSPPSPRGPDITLEMIVADLEWDEMFFELAKKNHCEENYQFLKACLDYSQLEDSGERLMSATTINRNYIVLGAEQEVNLLDDVRQRAKDGTKSGDRNLYEEAQRAAKDLLQPFVPQFVMILRERMKAEAEAKQSLKKNSKPRFSPFGKRKPKKTSARKLKKSSRTNMLEDFSISGGGGGGGSEGGGGTSPPHSPSQTDNRASLRVDIDSPVPGSDSPKNIERRSLRVKKDSQRRKERKEWGKEKEKETEDEQEQDRQRGGEGQGVGAEGEHPKIEKLSLPTNDVGRSSSGATVGAGAGTVGSSGSVPGPIELDEAEYSLSPHSRHQSEVMAARLETVGESEDPDEVTVYGNSGGSGGEFRGSTGSISGGGGGGVSGRGRGSRLSRGGGAGSRESTRGLESELEGGGEGRGEGEGAVGGAEKQKEKEKERGNIREGEKEGTRTKTSSTRKVPKSSSRVKGRKQR